MNLQRRILFSLLAAGPGLVVLTAGPVLADVRTDAVAAVQHCAGIADDRAWLDCFYGAAQPMRARLGLAPAPGVPANTGAVTAAPAMPAAPPRRKAGFFGRITNSVVSTMTGEDRPVVANMGMRAYGRSSKTGGFLVTLADGQKWEQDDGVLQVSWNTPPAGTVVNIYPGALGSFNLKFSGDSQKTFKVHRAK